MEKVPRDLNRLKASRSKKRNNNDNFENLLKKKKKNLRDLELILRGLNERVKKGILRWNLKDDKIDSRMGFYIVRPEFENSIWSEPKIRPESEKTENYF